MAWAEWTEFQEARVNGPISVGCAQPKDAPQGEQDMVARAGYIQVYISAYSLRDG